MLRALALFATMPQERLGGNVCRWQTQWRRRDYLALGATGLSPYGDKEGIKRIAPHLTSP